VPYGCGAGVGPGWYGVWTLPACAWPVWSTGGNTAEPTPEPAGAWVPGAMLGGAAWKDWPTRRHSPRIASALGNRSLGFFFRARAFSAAALRGCRRATEPAVGCYPGTCGQAMVSRDWA